MCKNYDPPNALQIESLELQLHISNSLGQNDNISCNNNPSVKEKLQQWVFDNTVTKTSVNSLLKILRSEGLDFPKYVRTLMNTLRTHNIIIINPGTYIHLDFKKMLSILLKFYA